MHLHYSVTSIGFLPNTIFLYLTETNLCCIVFIFTVVSGLVLESRKFSLNAWLDRIRGRQVIYTLQTQTKEIELSFIHFPSGLN